MNKPHENPGCLCKPCLDWLDEELRRLAGKGERVERFQCMPGDTWTYSNNSYHWCRFTLEGLADAIVLGPGESVTCRFDDGQWHVRRGDDDKGWRGSADAGWVEP